MKLLRFVLILGLGIYCSFASTSTNIFGAPESKELRENVSMFGDSRLVQVTDRVYLAYAYDLVNAVFVIGDDGVVIIDTLARVENAERALDSLRQITAKPIVAIIYSHGHFDHTGGSAAFSPTDSESSIAVYASAKWPRYRQELVSPLYPMINRRLIEQVGFAVATPGTERYEHVLGPVYPQSTTQSYVTPTHTISGRTQITLAGVKFEIVPIPSEMDDELVIWLPEERVAYAADTMAQMFPFLATPRSEPSRSPRGFIKAKDILLDWEPEHLLLGHGPVLSGQREVKALITNYRDVEQTLLDQTIAAINNGKTRNQAAADLRLPAHLANDPKLIDAYHRQSWVVKGLYTRLSGWFGNDVLEMVQHIPVEEAKRMIALAGGPNAMLSKARTALRAQDYPWATQLSTYLIRANQRSDSALQIKIDALKAMAANTHSSNERFYLLSGALWLERGEPIIPAFNLEGQTHMVPTSELIELLGPRLDPLRSADTNLTINLLVTDTQESFRLTVRRGVLERRSGEHSQPDLVLAMKRNALLAFTAKLSSLEELLSQDRVVQKGDASHFWSLLN